MKTIEVKFTMDDEVATIQEVREYAIGNRPLVPKRTIIGIALGNGQSQTSYLTSGGGHKVEDALIPYSEVKSYAIQWLTERLSVVAKEGL